MSFILLPIGPNFFWSYIISIKVSQNQATFLLQYAVKLHGVIYTRFLIVWKLFKIGSKNAQYGLCRQVVDKFLFNNETSLCKLLFFHFTGSWLRLSGLCLTATLILAVIALFSFFLFWWKAKTRCIVSFLCHFINLFLTNCCLIW